MSWHILISTQTLSASISAPVQLNTIIPLDVSYDYEYVDEASLGNLEDEVKEKIPSKSKSDVEFTLNSDLDRILGDRKSELVDLLKADHDDLLVIQALKKPSNPSGGNTLRTRTQAQSKTQPTSSSQSFSEVLVENHFVVTSNFDSMTRDLIDAVS
jgi:hypothetical protein